jgi:hypothetical protein
MFSLAINYSFALRFGNGKTLNKLQKTGDSSGG